MYFENLIEPEIVGNHYNMFLYGKNNSRREKLLKSIASKYPFHARKNKSCVVYLDEFGLPEVEIKAEAVDSSVIGDIAFRYLDLCIVEAILKKIVDSGELTKKEVKELIDYFYIDKPFNRPKSVEELIKRIKESKESYRQGYINYCANGEKDELYELVKKLDIPFIYSLRDFLETTQKIFKNQEPFTMILDRKSKICFISVRAVNVLIRTRNIDLICIKVACEGDEWESYTDYYHNYIFYPHDYLIVELDDSFKKLLNEQKRQQHQDE